MLHIYTKNIPEDKEFVHDVEQAFVTECFSLDTRLNRILLFGIEGCRIVDSQHLVDLNGCHLPVSAMSTGSKCAMLVESLPDKIIDTVECGVNAIYYIIECCSEGNIYVRDIYRLSNSLTSEQKKEIWIDGTVVSSTQALAEYIDEREWD